MIHLINLAHVRGGTRVTVCMQDGESGAMHVRGHIRARVHVHVRWHE